MIWWRIYHKRRSINNKETPWLIRIRYSSIQKSFWALIKADLNLKHIKTNKRDRVRDDLLIGLLNWVIWIFKLELRTFCNLGTVSHLAFEFLWTFHLEFWRKPQNPRKSNSKRRKSKVRINNWTNSLLCASSRYLSRQINFAIRLLRAGANFKITNLSGCAEIWRRRGRRHICVIAWRKGGRKGVKWKRRRMRRELAWRNDNRARVACRAIDRWTCISRGRRNDWRRFRRRATEFIRTFSTFSWILTWI